MRAAFGFTGARPDPAFARDFSADFIAGVRVGPRAFFGAAFVRGFAILCM